MPLDKYFQSAWKPKARLSTIIAAQHKHAWPRDAQYHGRGSGGKVKLEMRGGGRDWWHFLDVAAEQVEAELSLWRRDNAGFEFRVAPIVR